MLPRKLACRPRSPEQGKGLTYLRLEVNGIQLLSDLHSIADFYAPPSGPVASGRRPPKYVHSLSDHSEGRSGTRESHRSTNSAIHAALSTTVSVSWLMRYTEAGSLRSVTPQKTDAGMRTARSNESPDRGKRLRFLQKKRDGLLQHILTKFVLYFHKIN
jgi:hypothetical protein